LGNALKYASAALQFLEVSVNWIYSDAWQYESAFDRYISLCVCYCFD